MTAGAARDGRIAEAYLALAATLRSQNAGDFAILVLRLAIDLRPDFTAGSCWRPTSRKASATSGALQMLAPVAGDDP
jgi:hypothetical protein